MGSHADNQQTDLQTEKYSTTKLRTEGETKDRQITTLTTTNKTQKTELESQLATIKGELSTLQSDTTKYLPQNFHASLVYIMNCSSETALDMGGGQWLCCSKILSFYSHVHGIENARKAHGWPHHFKNRNQRLTMVMVEKNKYSSAWTLKAEASERRSHP